MHADKVTISIDSNILRRLDRLVNEKVFPSRSRAIQEAVFEKVERIDKNRLVRELEKLDIDEEQALADIGFAEDADAWDRY